MRKSYSEKLKDPRWQKKRLEIMNRDGFRCVMCLEDGKTLHVHHAIGYRKGVQPWEYCSHELQTLCEDCHSDEHSEDSLSLEDQKLSAIRWMSEAMDDTRKNPEEHKINFLEIIDVLNNISDAAKSPNPHHHSVNLGFAISKLNEILKRSQL